MYTSQVTEFRLIEIISLLVQRPAFLMLLIIWYVQQIFTSTFSVQIIVDDVTMTGIDHFPIGCKLCIGTLQADNDNSDLIQNALNLT